MGYLDKSESTVNGKRLETHTQVVGYRLICRDEPVLMALSKPMQTEFGIHHRLESYAYVICDTHVYLVHFVEGFLLQRADSGQWPP